MYEKFVIIIIQGKGKILCEVKKKLQKKLKKLLTKQKKTCYNSYTR